ncbi:MAG: MarR family winged helix-turn-helix transcriptional regulator [Thermomicrobiales bacterium]
MNLAELYYVGKVLQECATVGMRSVGESQLSTTEMMVAETLFAVGPCTIGAIAHRTGYAQSRVSTVVSALHARGLLMVQTDPRDRRRTIVALSDSALGEARRVSAQSARAVLEASFPHASREQLDGLVGAAESLLRSLDTGGSDRLEMDLLH